MVLLYISKRLKEALKIEALFKEAGIEYEVEPDNYVGGIIFRSERTGAFFYVDEEKEATARDLLTRSGYAPLS